PTSIHHMLLYHSLYVENSLLLFDQKNNGIAIPSPTSNQFFQFRQYAIENLGPVGKLLLPEEAHARIPWAVFPIKKPSPISAVRKGQPNPHAERPRQVGNRRV